MPRADLESHACGASAESWQRTANFAREGQPKTNSYIVSRHGGRVHPYSYLPHVPAVGHRDIPNRGCVVASTSNREPGPVPRIMHESPIAFYDVATEGSLDALPQGGEMFPETNSENQACFDFETV